MSDVGDKSLREARERAMKELVENMEYQILYGKPKGVSAKQVEYTSEPPIPSCPFPTACHTDLPVTLWDT